MNTLTLICGIPNAGKTTYSKQYQNVLHLDDYMHNNLMSLCYQECIFAMMKTEGDVCVEGVFNTIEIRKQLLKMLRIKGGDYHKKCIWVNTPFKICCAREKNEGCKPSSTVCSYATKFEIPTKEEGWDEIVEINRE